MLLYYIKGIKRTVEKNISRSVNQAVMSVPAEFNMAQRNATVRAASIAGINVVRVCVSAHVRVLTVCFETKKSSR